MPYWLLRAGIIYLRGWFQKPEVIRRLMSDYLRSYLRVYFNFRGICGYDARLEIPQSIQKPILIIGARYHEFSPLYVYQLFSFPIIVPLRWFTMNKPLLIGFPWFRFGRFLKTISYDDAPLEHNLDNIKRMLEAGHSVYVHLNHGLVDEREETMFAIHRALKVVLDWKVDSYFLRLSGFDNYKFSSMKNAILVSRDLIKTSELLPKPSDRTGSVVLEKVCEFFGFDMARVVGK
jgi:hypothetical protein